MYSFVSSKLCEQCIVVNDWVLQVTCKLLILQALDEIHNTTAHRDLKPDNIMLTGLDSGEVGVKILDWASSCSIHEGITHDTGGCREKSCASLDSQMCHLRSRNTVMT